MTKHICQDRACATVCPKCGALCTIYDSLGGEIGRPFPQPDLTKLRKVFKEYVSICTGDMTDIVDVELAIDKVIRVVKEVLDAETNNSSSNS